MRNQKSFALLIFVGFIFACLQTAAVGQTANDKLAIVTSGGSSVRLDVVTLHSGGTLTISAPDGRVFRKEFKTGASPEFPVIDNQGMRLPDGTYSYELRLTPAAFSSLVKGTPGTARGRDDEPEADRAARRIAVAPATVQSGSFAILNGMVVVAGAVEGQRTGKITQRTPAVISGNTVTRLRNHRLSIGAAPDDVVADDQIVQGSECVGLDCVSGEVFGFDTIRMKENNTRLQFDDTSVSAGFPTNNWQIRANSSASGGESFLGFVDQGTTGNSETGTIVFQVNAGAPANAVKVSSAGKVGFRTGTPVLDLHITTSDTPAHRLEQTSAGGFTAQTWDIAGNEANFFVRDVTGGSRLPFRIRPGAPTSSIDISADGDVGIGTASPAVKLHSQISSANTAQPATGADIGLFIGNSNTTANNLAVLSFGNAANGGQGQIGVINLGSTATAGGHMFFTTRTAGASIAERMRITSAGDVGIGTTAPDQKFSVNGDASKTGGATWQAFSDVRLKNIKGNYTSGLRAVMQLQPLRYEYKPDNALGLVSEGEHIGFGAQALQKVIPEAVTKNANGYLMVNSDPILWTMLNAIKEQQKEIAELKSEVRKLRAASHRRRK